jgi:radical SAM protein with 4Fe4S-binding SPASM domain
MNNKLIRRAARLVYRSILPLPLQVVEIETTTVCNRACHYCPNYTVGRPHRYMEENTFVKIIDSLKRHGFTGRISPHFYGEPLMDSRIVSLIEYTHKSIPKAKIKLFTNGDLLTVEKYLVLKRAGVELFIISQHSPMPSDAIKDTLSYIRMNHPELYTVENEDYYHTNDKFNRGGLVDVKPEKRKYCFVVNQLVFDYLGNAVLCCNDYNSSHIFGNINNKDVHEIWYDKQFVRARNMIQSGFWHYDICRKCVGEML